MQTKIRIKNLKLKSRERQKDEFLLTVNHFSIVTAMIGRAKFLSILINSSLALAILISCVHARQPHGEKRNSGGGGGGGGGGAFISGGRIERGGDGGGKGGMGRHRGGHHNRFNQGENDLALWINEQQVKILSGNNIILL